MAVAGDRTIRAKADSLEAAQNWKVALQQVETPRAYKYRAPVMPCAYKYRAPINTARLRAPRAYEYRAPINTARI